MHVKDNGISVTAGELYFHPAVRFIARVISVLFHPLFIPVYISWFLIYQNPFFPGINNDEKGLLLLRFFIMYSMFPMVTILLVKGLGFVQSVYLKTQKDRIIPYVACGVYYFWMWYVLRNQPQLPKQMTLVALAIFLASSGGLIANSYFKVSMHSIAVGVLITFMLLFGFDTAVSSGIYISIAFLIAGIVCTARLVNSDHNPFEVYAGLFIGILAQLLANYII